MEMLGLLDVPLWPLLLLLTLVLVYIYGTWPYSLFKSRGIPGPSPEPFVGNARQLTAGSTPLILSSWVKKYGKVFGMYQARMPVLMVTDLEVIRRVFISDFSKCLNRRLPVPDYQWPLNNGLAFAQGNHWRKMRSILNPTFSLAKLKSMMCRLNSCAGRMAEKVLEKAHESRDIPAKRTFDSYTMDVISSTAFGIDTSSQQDTVDPFVLNAHKLFEGNMNLSLRVLIPIIFPFLTPIFRWLNIGLLPRDTLEFFVARVKEMLQYRRNCKGNFKSQPDFLQLMLNAELPSEKENDVSGKSGSTANGETPNSKGTGLTEEEMVGNGLTFFMAGYDTTSSLLHFLLYRLARHQQVQEKLFQEVSRLQQEEVTFEDMQDLPYMEQVISETLRLHPPTTILARRLSEDIQVGDVTLPKEAAVWVSVRDVHLDPENFPDPLTFDPERFSPENRKSLHPLAFLPFGAGPRMCIGMRLSLTEAKVAIVHLLRKMKVIPGRHTPDEIQYRNVVLLQPATPIEVKVIPRS